MDHGATATNRLALQATIHGQGHAVVHETMH